MSSPGSTIFPSSLSSNISEHCHQKMAGQAQAAGGLSKLRKNHHQRNNRKCIRIWILYTRYGRLLIHIDRYLDNLYFIRYMFLWYPYVNQIPKVIKYYQV